MHLKSFGPRNQDFMGNRGPLEMPWALRKSRGPPLNHVFGNRRLPESMGFKSMGPQSVRLEIVNSNRIQKSMNLRSRVTEILGGPSRRLRSHYLWKSVTPKSAGPKSSLPEIMAPKYLKPQKSCYRKSSFEIVEAWEIDQALRESARFTIIAGESHCCTILWAFTRSLARNRDLRNQGLWKS